MAKLERRKVEREPEPEPEEAVIHNVQGCARLHFRKPERGGLVILVGDNGGGKSTALEAVNAALGKKTQLRPTDGADSGSVKFGGVTLRVGQSTRRSGELEFASLEDRLTIRDLIDPRIADPVAADERRLKALLRVRGDTADADVFYDLLGGEECFKEIVPAEVIAEKDVVRMAAGIKRAIEAEARKVEENLENKKRDALARRQAVNGCDLSAECDEAKLQAALEAAIGNHKRAELSHDAAASAAESLATAREQLEAAEREYGGPTVEQAEANLQAKIEATSLAQKRIDAIRNELRMAEQDLKDREAESQAANREKAAAEAHARAIAGWRETVAMPLSRGATAEEVTQAKAALEAARKAHADGAVLRANRAKLDEAAKLEADAALLAEQAEQLRQAAKGTDDVLTDLVRGAGGPFIVGTNEKGEMRLQVKHRRGVIPFADLSMGERLALVVPVAVEAVGEGGVFCIDQELFEGLQPRNQKLVQELLVGSGVTCITALPADGAVRAVIPGESGDAAKTIDELQADRIGPTRRIDIGAPMEADMIDELQQNRIA
jgi:hypothetical protein